MQREKRKYCQIVVLKNEHLSIKKTKLFLSNVTFKKLIKVNHRPKC